MAIFCQLRTAIGASRIRCRFGIDFTFLRFLPSFRTAECVRRNQSRPTTHSPLVDASPHLSAHVTASAVRSQDSGIELLTVQAAFPSAPSDTAEKWLGSEDRRATRQRFCFSVPFRDAWTDAHVPSDTETRRTG